MYTLAMQQSYFKMPSSNRKHAQDLPASAYLDTGLADVNGDNLTHGCCLGGSTSCIGKGAGELLEGR